MTALWLIISLNRRKGTRSKASAHCESGQREKIVQQIEMIRETSYGNVRNHPEQEGKYIINLWLNGKYEVEEVVVDDSVFEAAWGRPLTPEQVVGSWGCANDVARYIATEM